MHPPHLVAVATLSSALLLTACADSDNGSAQDTPADDSPAATGNVSAESGDAGSATDDAVDQSAGVDDDVVTAEPEGQGVVSLDEAEGLAQELLTRAARSTQRDAGEAEQDIVNAFRGPTREAALAADRLEPVTGEPPERDLQQEPVQPNVLAISRDDGSSPELILVQTAPEGELPELHLLSRPESGGGFRITWSAPMLPGTEVGTFDRRSVGSPVLRKGRGDFGVAPEQALKALAEYVDYPPSDALDVRTSGYAPQVRKNADAQADEVAQQASLREENSVTADSIQTLSLEDGSGITFAVLDRETVFDVRDDSRLIPPDTFTTFVEDESLTDSATIDTVVFVAMRLPAEEGPAELIAAREQVVDASGS